jgi:hypothetical protein
VASSVSATFSDDGSNSPYAEVEVVSPRRFIFNTVTVQGPAGKVIVSDDSSAVSFGNRGTLVDTPLDDVDLQRSLGDYVLVKSKDPQARVFGLRVPVHKDLPEIGPDVIPLEQGDRVTFERTPLGVGDPIVYEQIIEGYTERFDSVSWTWTPHLSPAEPVTFGVWGTGAWDDSLTWGY